MAANDVSSRIVNALYLSDPDLDTSIGTPLRKILDAVAEQIDQAATDPYLLSYQYDIDSKSGGELDDFVANFGLARLQGRRAGGVVSFSRSSAIASITSVSIGPGTQVVSLSIPPIYAQTTISATMALGQSSVDIPVQAIVPGPSGNLLSGSLNTLVSNIDGVSTVSNGAPLTGGTLDETDDQLRARFRSTVFRNLAGTDSMYRGVALQTLANPTDPASSAVTQVNILGATKHNIEQIAVVGGTATSSLTSSAYNIANSTFVGPSISVGNILNLGGDFTATANNAVLPAQLTIASVGTNMPDGVYDLEYDYVPIASRNDPNPLNTRWNQGVVNNRVDIYVNGITSASATQTLHYVNTIVFNNTANDPLLRTRFITLGGANPANNDVFVPLGFGPVLTIPPSFVVGGQTYTIGVDYDIVHQNDAFGYAASSIFGILFHLASAQNVAHPIANNSSISMTYTYNQVPQLVSDNLANWRLLGTDVKVHAGLPAYLQLNFAVVYENGSTPAAVNTGITTALSTLLLNLGFSAGVQKSDLIEVAHNVPGVDNIRLTNSGDNVVTYGIQLVTSTGTVLNNFNSGGRPVDVYFDERTYPILFNINFNTKARNTFGT